MRFALVGAAGFVAPRHMKAIKETGHELVAALDPHDSVGVLDSYFPECRFFRQHGDFAMFLRDGEVDYVSVCTPNDTHFDFCCAMAHGVDVICEKPLVLRSEELNDLRLVEEETGKRVYAVMQLRCHPGAGVLREVVAQHKGPHVADFCYVTPRGPWYDVSWKGNPALSGGLLTNIGVHLFDLVLSLFGEPKAWSLNTPVSDRACSGEIVFADARLSWRLSVDAGSAEPCRRLTVDHCEVDFKGMADLHTELYRRTLAGQGYGIEDVRPVTELLERMRRVTG